MKMTQTIKQQREILEEKEKRVLMELETSEESLRAKAKTVSKIALISGVAALIVYWGFNAFSDDPKKKKKKKKKNNSSSRLSTIVTPYIVKYLSEVLGIDEDGSNDLSEPEE